MKRFLDETCDSLTLGWVESANRCGARQHTARDCPIAEAEEPMFRACLVNVRQYANGHPDVILGRLPSCWHLANQLAPPS